MLGMKMTLLSASSSFLRISPESESDRCVSIIVVEISCGLSFWQIKGNDTTRIWRIVTSATWSINTLIPTLRDGAACSYCERRYARLWLPAYHSTIVPLIYALMVIALSADDCRRLRHGKVALYMPRDIL